MSFQTRKYKTTEDSRPLENRIILTLTSWILCKKISRKKHASLAGRTLVKSFLHALENWEFWVVQLLLLLFFSTTCSICQTIFSCPYRKKCYLKIDLFFYPSFSSSALVWGQDHLGPEGPQETTHSITCIILLPSSFWEGDRQVKVSASELLSMFHFIVMHFGL